MKKWIILLTSTFLLLTFACDGQNSSNSGCGGTDDAADKTFRSVPTCGKGVTDSEGNYHIDRQLFVNWTSSGAPTEPSNDPGFGGGEPRPLNAYSWTLTSFDDYLYVGVYNRLNDRQSAIPDTSEGGEIWRYKAGSTVNSGTWTQEVAAGFGNLTNLGIRILMVYNNQLFAGTHNLDEGTELWRRAADSADGTKGQWQVISTAGFGDSANNASRSMAVFNNKLYIGTANNRTGAKLFKFDAATDTLSQVAKIGDNDKKANVVSELVPFGDHLWIFTWGGTVGLSAFRMDRQENIQEAGLDDVNTDPNNTGIMSSAVLNGKIYLGTVNLVAGAQLFVLENPAVADLTDIAWNRLGANVFQITEKYLWRIQAFNDHLYIGTWNPYNTRAPLTSWNNIGATLYRMDKDEGFCQVMGHKDLIEPGFGQSENYGIRSMAEHEGRLYIGTAQVFKIEPGSDDSNAANREGTEVWEFDPISN